MNKTTARKLKRGCRKVLKTIKVIAAFTGSCTLGLCVYGTLKYPNTIFTTDPNFQHLSDADPLLFKMELGCLIICIVCLALLYGAARLVEWAKKN